MVAHGFMLAENEAEYPPNLARPGTQNSVSDC
jgi:hypothetical protein